MKITLGNILRTVIIAAFVITVLTYGNYCMRIPLGLLTDSQLLLAMLAVPADAMVIFLCLLWLFNFKQKL